MLTTRSLALSLTVAAFAVLGAGCQGTGDQTPAAAAGRAAADNTVEICDDFRHFEVDHLDTPAASTPVGSLESFHTAAAADLRKLADRATDPTVSAQLKAVTAQVSVLAEQGAGRTYGEVEPANADVFAAGGQAWVALEARCGKAIIPTP